MSTRGLMRYVFALQPLHMFCGILAAVMLASILGATPMYASEASIGAVDTLKGDVIIVRKESPVPQPIKVGDPVFQEDIIQTMANGRVKIRFVDDTVVSLGSDGVLKITEFVYSPEKQERHGRMSVPKGIFRTVLNVFVPNTNFEVSTATAVASVRGTDWITRASAEETTSLVVEGSVVFRNSDSGVDGDVTLNAGEGTTISAGAAPNPPGVWGQARVRQFVEETLVE